MSLRLLFGLLAGGLCLLCGACANQITLPVRPRLECKVPVQVCAPERASGVTIDTGGAGGGVFLAISRVRGLDGDADEFGLGFQWGRHVRSAIATIRSRTHAPDSAKERLVSVRIIRADQVAPGDPVATDDLVGSIGEPSGSARTDTLVIAAGTPTATGWDYDLFAARYRNTLLEGPQRIGASADGSWDAQPALTPDGASLYFASDRPGGFGGTDIWVTHRIAGGGWSEPENLGPGVNTPCDELTPYVSGDGAWLYFSSSGHATYGGYDLFRAPISRGQAGGAMNLGAPVNTPGDEIFPSAPFDASPDTLLYYSSNQSGSRGFDVYVLHQERRAVTASSAQRHGERTKLTGTITDTEGEPVDSALVTIEPHDSPEDRDSTFTDPRGHYEFDVERGKSYEVIAGSEKTLYSREQIRIPQSGGRGISRDIALPDTVTFRINFPFNNATDPYEFTLDDRGLPGNERWTEVIDRIAGFLKRTHAGGRVEVVGHTDPVGSDPFNLDLGRRRAEFVYRELIRRGVAAGSLIVRSEGESQPLPQREGESEEEYHARLRRVELIRK